jgi:methylglyoxal synthase
MRSGQYEPTIRPAATSPARWSPLLRRSPVVEIDPRPYAPRSSEETAVHLPSSATRTVAFITTAKFRDEHPTVVDEFVWLELYRLAQRHRIVCSGSTFDFVQRLLARDLADLPSAARDQIRAAMQVEDLGREHYAAWQSRLVQAVETRLPGAAGIVEILFDLVEGRLAGVIHLAHPSDLDAKADSRVLWRAANVHDVPIAHDVNTASSFVAAWQSRAPRVTPTPRQLGCVLQDLDAGKKVIAMISHDGKKAEMCRFARETAERIASYDCILATATTAARLAETLRAHDPAWPVHKIRACLSGPEGGDIQIAYAVVRGLCQKVVFFQDPWTSHPHEVDIRLLEKVVLECRHPVELATNRSAAEIIL